MSQNETESEWREKVNPIFTLLVQFLQLVVSLFQAESENQRKRLLIETCEKAISLLPEGPTDMTSIDMADWQKKFGSQAETAWLADPKVCDALARFVGRIKGIPKARFTRHFAKPHWWMTNSSWSEFFQEQEWSESLLNLLSVLHLSLPLPELTQRVSDGDFDLTTKLFRASRNGIEDGKSARLLERMLQPVRDRATKMVARQLLLRADPPGHWLRLRVALYLGWDFGLSDLSARELHDFLAQLNIIRDSYDPETLRRYRDRLRAEIDKSRRSPSRINE